MCPLAPGEKGTPN
jgi:WD40 repeat protein